MSESDLEYSIATSWDDALLEGLVEQNAMPGVHTRVAEIYGAHRETITGGGRPSYRLPDVSDQTFRRHLTLAHNLGLRFNYVLNAPSFGGRENDPEWLRQVTHFLESLADAGVDSLTVANKHLVQMVSRDFPDFRLHLSLIADIDTVEEARYFESMGADVIILSPFTANRDFVALREIRSAVSCKLELYANIPCLNQCSYRQAHYSYSGRDSQIGGSRKVVRDPFLTKCSSIYLSDPVELLRSPFIRPEDIELYEELGIDVIKLSDRSETTSFLLSTANSYLTRHYDGNLFDLIFRSGQKFRAGLVGKGTEVSDLELPVQIDNSMLTTLNFIEQIRDLEEPDLSEFYQYATEKAVSMPNVETLCRWQSVLNG